MAILIVTKNLKIDEQLSSYAESKLGKLSKYLSNISSVKLELSEEKSKSRQHLYTAQVTLNINGFLIRGEQKKDDIHASIDAVADVMERLVVKYKERYEITKRRVPESIRKPPLEDVEKDNAGKDGVIVKSKSFLIKPMTIEQAIDQMEFLGHDFFIFVNDGENSVNVIYRRKDGKYGLILPELA